MQAGACRRAAPPPHTYSGPMRELRRELLGLIKSASTDTLKTARGVLQIKPAPDKTAPIKPEVELARLRSRLSQKETELERLRLELGRMEAKLKKLRQDLSNAGRLPALKRMSWETLGIGPKELEALEIKSMSPLDILRRGFQAIYRGLAHKHHPDRGGDDLKFSAIDAAFKRIDAALEKLLS
jgi:hypothetical protein